MMKNQFDSAVIEPLNLHVSDSQILFTLVKKLGGEVTITPQEIYPSRGGRLIYYTDAQTQNIVFKIVE